MQQVYQGVHVYDALIKVHLDLTKREIIAASNSFVPNLSLPTVQPALSANDAIAVAQGAAPKGIPVTEPHLFVYAGIEGPQQTMTPHLVWLVDMLDMTAPAHNIYVVDAAEGTLVDVLNRLYTDTSLEQTGPQPGAEQSTYSFRGVTPLASAQS